MTPHGTRIRYVDDFELELASRRSTSASGGIGGGVGKAAAPTQSSKAHHRRGLPERGSRGASSTRSLGANNGRGKSHKNDHFSGGAGGGGGGVGGGAAGGAAGDKEKCIIS